MVFNTDCEVQEYGLKRWFFGVPAKVSIVVDSLNKVVPVLVWIRAVGRRAPDSEDVVDVSAIEKE